MSRWKLRGRQERRDDECILVCRVGEHGFWGHRDEVGRAKCPEHGVLLKETTEDDPFS
jgi:hypothetical protein